MKDKNSVANAILCMQMFAIAVTCGNTFVLKPSEKDPGDSLVNSVLLKITESM